MTEEEQEAPEFTNLKESVSTLAEKKYIDLLGARTSVREFWEDEIRGGLCRILIYFSSNPEVTKISENEREQINNILSTVSSKLGDWETSKVGNADQHIQLDREIRQMYTEAVLFLKQYLNSRAPDLNRHVTQDQSIDAKPTAQPRQDQILNLIKDFFMVMEWIPQMQLTGERCVLEANIPNNMPNVLTWAQMGTGHCDSLRREYGALSNRIEGLLPTLNWDSDRREKAKEAFQRTNFQIGKVETCFRHICRKKEKIKNEISNLRDQYRQYCVITISEILSRREDRA